MLRFNLEEDMDFTFEDLFQYILCYGSTFTRIDLALDVFKFQYILCYGSTQLS